MQDPVVVAVGEGEFVKAEAVFTTTPGVRGIPAPDEEEAMARRIREAGARAAIVGTRAYRDALYAALPRGGVIARFGVGHDGIDKARATRNGLLCSNTPGVLDQSVAELAMLMISAAARHLLPMAGDVRAGEWKPYTGTELRGRKLAVIGCGRIGGRLAEIAAGGFHMEVACTGRGDDYDAAVRDADFVSLHIPAKKENRRFIDRERLSALPRKAWLINTSRGMVLDESALYDALAAGRIAGAALDVFEAEPYAPIDRARDLRRLPNVILTPHVGSNTVAAGRRIAERALQNILLAESGRFSEMDLLNPEVLSAD